MHSTNTRGRIDVVGKVAALALRTKPKGPMQEVHSVTAIANKGLMGDVAARPDRGITLLSAAQWRDVTRELRADLPWHTRRANVLVDAGSLEHLIGKTVCVGAIEVRVEAETEPCGLMDRLHDGLRKALTPECRGGVYGRITRGGKIKIGDAVSIA